MISTNANSVLGLGLVLAISLSSDVLGQGFVPYDEAVIDGEAQPTAFTTLQVPQDILTDGVVSVIPRTALPSPLPAALYPQATLLAPTDTDLDRYEVFQAYSIDGFEPVFSGPLELVMSYFDADVVGDESGLSLFRFNWDDGRWMSVASTVDEAANTVGTEITERGIYGLGRPTTPASPPSTNWKWLTIFGLLLAASILLLARWRRRRAAGPLGLVLLYVSLLGVGTQIGQASSPQVTNPGGKPINHTEKVSAVEQSGTIGGVPATRVCVSMKLWRFKGGDLDPTQEASWEKIPKNYYVLKNRLPGGPPGVADDPGIPGATPAEPWDKDVDPFYDCAGYAMRGSSYTPLDPNVDGRVIIDEEYDCLGPANGNNYRVGDVVTYKKDGKTVHYALVTRVDSNGNITELTSKWGRTRLMKHGLTNVPGGYGSADQVYRKR